MKEGKKYIHVYNCMITCEILSLTAKGCKVKQVEQLVEQLGKNRTRSTTEFYNKQDFIGVYSFWKEL